MDDDKPLSRSEVRNIRDALLQGWGIDDAKREELVKLLYKTATEGEYERSRIMAMRTLLDMHKADQACAMKLLDKEQPDKHEHNVTSTITSYQLPSNGRD